MAAIKHLPKINFWQLYVLCGWISIAVYFSHYPASLSLIGLVYYLLISTGAVFIVLFLMPKLFFSSKDSIRFWDSVAGKGRFFREFRRSLGRKFPKLKPLLCQKDDYANIHLDSDFKELKAKHHQKKQRDSLWQFFYSYPQARYRLRYRDVKIKEDYIKEYNHQVCKTSSWKLYLRLTWMLLVKIPAEDGVFLAPLCFIGINIPTAIVFALAFGFFHFRYSIINCLRIAAWHILTIFLILPNYGLLTCIVGHVLYDFLIIAPPIVLESLAIKSKAKTAKTQSAR